MSKRINQKELEKRLQSIAKIYENFGDVFDKVWAMTPDFPGKQEKGQWIKDIVLQDKELKNLMDGFQNNRPPKFMLVGSTGVGKSSLINALCGAYRAKVSDVNIGTAQMEPYEIQRDGKTILHVLDTRGIAERSPINGESAEQALKRSMYNFEPDVILVLFNIAERHNAAKADVEEIQKLKRWYYSQKLLDKKRMDIPIIAVLTRTDMLPPEDERQPAEYSKAKKNLIQENMERYQEDFSAWGFYPKEVVAVSASIDWGHPNHELNEMTPSEREKLVPKKDCRYNIDELVDVITSCLPNDAAMGFVKVAKLEAVLSRIASRIVGVFSAMSAMVAATPIPFADMPVLWGLEGTMVTLIAAIGGEQLSAKAAGKFLLSVMGIVGVGFFAQQLSRFLNAIVPLGGSTCSAVVASGTMRLLGEAAIQYYIQHEQMGQIRKETKEQIDELRISNP